MHVYHVKKSYVPCTQNSKDFILVTLEGGWESGLIKRKEKSSILLCDLLNLSHAQSMFLRPGTELPWTLFRNADS